MFRKLAIGLLVMLSFVLAVSLIFSSSLKPKSLGVYLVAKGKLIKLKADKPLNKIVAIWGFENLSGINILDERPYLIIYRPKIPTRFPYADVYLCELKYKKKGEIIIDEHGYKDAVPANMRVIDEINRTTITKLIVEPFEGEIDMYYAVLGFLSPGAYVIGFEDYDDEMFTFTVNFKE